MPLFQFERKEPIPLIISMPVNKGEIVDVEELLNLTGILLMTILYFRAIYSSSTSNEKPGLVRSGNSARAMSPRNALKPHCVSNNPPVTRRRTKKENILEPFRLSKVRPEAYME